jgi:hypothetical protein
MSTHKVEPVLTERCNLDVAGEGLPIFSCRGRIRGSYSRS